MEVEATHSQEVESLKRLLQEVRILGRPRTANPGKDLSLTAVLNLCVCVFSSLSFC